MQNDRAVQVVMIVSSIFFIHCLGNQLRTLIIKVPLRDI